MRELAIHRRLEFDAPRARVFDVVTDPRNLTSFTGYGPIPGVAEVRHEDPVTVGSEFHVRNSDGSTHRERVELLAPPESYRIHIFGFDSPFRFLISHAVEQLDFAERGGQTVVEREFRFALRSALWLPIALPLLYVAFGRALDRNYERLRELVARAA